MSDPEQFRAILKLQEEIDAKIDQYVELIKHIDDREKGFPLVELNGEIYQLRKTDLDAQTLEAGRKHRGFFLDYRLVKLGKPVK
jgi:hypothetical protein